MTNSHVSDFVKNYRKKYGLSQSQLAKKIGVSSKYISNIEREHRWATDFCFALISILDEEEEKELIDIMRMDSNERILRRKERRKSSSLDGQQ